MADTYEAPPAPADIGPSGRELWDWLIQFEPETHEVALIREGVRTVDLLDRLEEIIRSEGPVVSSPQGPKANPAAVEARQQRITLARIIAALRIPDEDAPGMMSRRAQRRTGTRGVYPIRTATG